MAAYQQAPALLCACLMLVLMAGAASGGRVDVEDMLMMDRFRGWQATYNRSYLTAAERLRRFEVYRQNMELIEATNRRAGLSYQLGETPFTDLTSEEFLATHTMSTRLHASEAARRHRELITTHAGPVSDGGRQWNRNYTTDLDVPESVDWRTKGAVTPVKDQGACGSCWSFVTVAAIEGLHKIRTGQLVSLSEQAVLDCSSPPNHGCNRGDPAAAIDWVSANGGLTTESDYPYVGRQGKCKLDKARNHVAKIKGRKLVDQNNEAALEVAVAQQPVAVDMNVDPILQHYKSGVFHGPCDPEDRQPRRHHGGVRC
ncbi:Fruit bromelain [Zea mays]|uniref:Cysteine proteinases superfamily protein n=2 Tax=Zea mays TaxID=4577 RepID=A0A1D6IIP1_MAIZE|nr:Cysteine proteinases superfamily protein [Zea mays]PWZ14758.1 Fruit bromelain [Zea mays]